MTSPDVVEAEGGENTALPTDEAVHAVIDAGDVQTVFQPIVHLDSRSVVGFEALSRGPDGSGLEEPMRLLAAANRVGRLGELDWLCRTHAVELAARADLPPSLSWFINVEAAGVATPCPDHLRGTWALAHSQLRVVLEITDRDVETNVTRLLRTCQQARVNTWGVAVDDINASTTSLALLPLLRPDVIKFDMSHLHAIGGDELSRTVAAIGTYAEHHDAVILAKNIESDEQEMLARAIGARYGQGYLYGKPGPLPPSLTPPLHVIPLRQNPEQHEEGDLWRILTDSRPVSRDARAVVAHIEDVLEQLVLHSHDPALVLTCVDKAHFAKPETQRRYEGTAASSALTIVAGEGITPRTEPGFRAISLQADSALVRQRVAIILTAHDAAAIAVHGTTHRGAGDPVEYVYTRNRELVITAARAMIHAMEPETDLELFGNDSDDQAPVESPPAVQQRDRGRRGLLRLLGRDHED